VIYLDKVEGRQMVRMHSQIGNASPVYCTGVGKAALSALPDDEVERRIASLRFHPYTPTTMPDAESLRREIAEIRRTGIAYDREEHEPGIHCVAAPIHSSGRGFTAGVSVTAPAYRIPMARLEEWEPLVRQCVVSIMEDMASRLGPRS
jgi:DNA-binding IclR family transcriptional regulator